MPFGGMEKAAIWVLGLLDLAAHIALPLLVPWGLVRWVKGKQRRSVCALLSLTGFTFASLSFLLAVSSALYAGAIGGFPFYDPLLMRIIRWGFRLSLVGFVLGISGAWRPNPLRWHAPACALGMLMVWIGSAMAE